MNFSASLLCERGKELITSPLALAPAETMEKYGPLMASFLKYCQENNRSFTGPVTPQHSVELMMKVVESATVEKDGGSFVSQFGDKTWL